MGFSWPKKIAGITVAIPVSCQMPRPAGRHGRSIPAGAPQPLRELPPAVGRTQDPHRSQRQTPPSLLALGNPLRVISRIASLRKSSAAKRHAGGTGSLRPEPIRHRGRSGDAARQAPTLSPSPAEIHRMIRDCARLPLVGPGGSKNHQKGDSVPSYLTIAFQAHPSMRICSAGRQSAHLPGTRRPA
jgi:hypothetical protein